MDYRGNVIGKCPVGRIGERFLEKSEKWVDGEDKKRPGERAALDDSRHNLVERFSGVFASV